MELSDSDLSSSNEVFEIYSESNTSCSSDEEAFIRAAAKLPRKPKPRNFFERIDPMDKYDEDEFLKRFRFSKEIVHEIAELLKPQLSYHDNRNHPLSVLMQVLVALLYYATRSFQIVSGDLFGIHQVTCGRIAKRVSTALGTFAETFIKMPETAEEVVEIKQSFFNKFGFPNVLGIVDGTHIPISSPGGSNAESFRNRKGFFSINTQVVCDANLKFISIDARWPGSTHDQTVFNFSHLFAKFEQNVYSDGYLLGDAGYGCRKYLLTPIQNAITDNEKKYNLCFVRTRQTIERAIGVWKRRFPILSAKIQVDVNFVVVIIVATAVLHNFAIDKKATLPPDALSSSGSKSRHRIIGRFRGGDTSTRDSLIANFFTS